LASVTTSNHPLILSKLAGLRDRATTPPEFRRLVRASAMLLAAEATADLAMKDIEVQTPLAIAKCRILAQTIAVVPVLRAGLGMAEGVLDVIPEAEVWHIGLRRNEATLAPEQYYTRVPELARVGLAILVDPMLATGGSAVNACELLKASGVPKIKFLAILAAPEGVARLSAAMPDVDIHVGAIDDCLNAIGYIFPGLGDAGDRQFGT
jgi:uracil phosphoribosyltransferase